MSNWDIDDDDQIATGGQLRTQLEKALAKAKAAETELATIRAERDEARAVDILSAKGYGPVVARFATKDGVDLSNEKALDKWLADNGDQFVKVETAETQTTTEGAAQVQPVVETPTAPNPGVAVFGAINGLHAAASPQMQNAYEAAMASLPEDATTEQVLKAFKGL